MGQLTDYMKQRRQQQNAMEAFQVQTQPGDPNFSLSSNPSSQAQFPAAAAESRMQDLQTRGANRLDDAFMAGFDTTQPAFDPLQQAAEQGFTERALTLGEKLLGWIDGPRQAVNLLIQDMSGGQADEGLRNPNFGDYWNTLWGGMEDEEGFLEATGLNPRSGSHTIDMFGWAPEDDFPGRVLRGVTDFGLQVLTDPLSYVTFGLSGLGKKAAHGAARALQKESIDKIMPLLKEGVMGRDELVRAGLTDYQVHLVQNLDEITATFGDDLKNFVMENNGEFPAKVKRALNRYLGEGNNPWANMTELALANRIAEDVMKPLIARNFKGIDPLALQELPLWARGGARISIPFTQNTLAHGFEIPGTRGLGKELVGDRLRNVSERLRNTSGVYRRMANRLDSAKNAMDMQRPLLEGLKRPIEQGGIYGWQYQIAMSAIDNIHNQGAREVITAMLNSKFQSLREITDLHGLDINQVKSALFDRLERADIDGVAARQAEELFGPAGEAELLTKDWASLYPELDTKLDELAGFLRETFDEYHTKLGALDPSVVDKYIKGYTPHKTTDVGRRIMQELALAGAAPPRGEWVTAQARGEPGRGLFARLIAAISQGGKLETNMGASRYFNEREAGRTQALTLMDESGLVLIDEEMGAILREATQPIVRRSGAVDVNALETRYIPASKMNELLRPVVEEQAKRHGVVLPRDWDGKIFSEDPFETAADYVGNLDEAIRILSAMDSLTAAGLAMNHSTAVDLQDVLQKIMSNLAKRTEKVQVSKFGSPEGVRHAPVSWLKKIAYPDDLARAEQGRGNFAFIDDDEVIHFTFQGKDGTVFDYDDMIGTDGKNGGYQVYLRDGSEVEISEDTLDQLNTTSRLRDERLTEMAKAGEIDLGDDVFIRGGSIEDELGNKQFIDGTRMKVQWAVQDEFGETKVHADEIDQIFIDEEMGVGIISLLGAADVGEDIVIDNLDEARRIRAEYEELKDALEFADIPIENLRKIQADQKEFPTRDLFPDELAANSYLLEGMDPNLPLQERQAIARHGKRGTQEEFIEDMRKHGVKTPVVLLIDKNWNIVVQDGHNRIANAEAAGLSELPVRIEFINDVDDFADDLGINVEPYLNSDFKEHIGKQQNIGQGRDHISDALKKLAGLIGGAEDISQNIPISSLFGEISDMMGIPPDAVKNSRLAGLYHDLYINPNPNRALESIDELRRNPGSRLGDDIVPSGMAITDAEADTVRQYLTVINNRIMGVEDPDEIGVEFPLPEGYDDTGVGKDIMRAEEMEEVLTPEEMEQGVFIDALNGIANVFGTNWRELVMNSPGAARLWDAINGNLEMEMIAKGLWTMDELPMALLAKQIELIDDLSQNVSKLHPDELTVTNRATPPQFAGAGGFNLEDVFGTLPWDPSPFIEERNILKGSQGLTNAAVPIRIQAEVKRAKLGNNDPLDLQQIFRMAKQNIKDFVSQSKHRLAPGAPEPKMLSSSHNAEIKASISTHMGNTWKIEFEQGLTLPETRAAMEWAMEQIDQGLKTGTLPNPLGQPLTAKGFKSKMVKMLAEGALDDTTSRVFYRYLQRKMSSLPDATVEWMTGDPAELVQMRSLFDDWSDEINTFIKTYSALQTSSGELVADPGQLKLLGYDQVEKDIQSLHDAAEKLADAGYDEAVRVMRDIEDLTSVADPNYVNPGLLALGGPAVEGMALQRDIALWMRNIARNSAYMYTPEGIAAAKIATNNALRWWRGMATIARPSFHIRNLVGGAWMNLIHSVSNKNYARVARNAPKLREALRAGKTLDEAFDTLPADVREMFRAAWENDIMSGFASTEFRRLTASEKRSRMAWAKVWDVDDFVLSRAGGKVMESVEDLLRVSLFDKYFDPTNPESAKLAKEMVMATHFDYVNLTQLETKLKSFIPFFVWTRRNLPRQLQLAVENPRYVQRYRAMMQSMNDNFGGNDEELMPQGDSFSAFAAGTDYFVNPNTPFWARVMIDPDLPIRDLTALPVPSIGNLTQYVNDMIGPHISTLVDVNEQRDFGDVNAPAPFNAILSSLAAVGLFDETADGDVRIPYYMRSILETALPFTRESIDPITGGPSDPNRQARLGIAEDDGTLESILKNIAGVGLSGLGVKATTPADVRGVTSRTNEELDALIQELRLQGDFPASQE